MSKNEEELRSKSLLILTCTLLGAMLISFLPDVYLGLWENLWYALVPCIHLVVILLLRKRFFTFSVHLFLIGANINVFYFADTIGRESYVHLTFFVLMLLVPALVSPKRLILFSFYFVVPILLLLILIWWDFGLIDGGISVSKEDEKFFGRVNILLLVVLFPGTAYLIAKAYRNLYKKVLVSEQTLSQRNEELRKTNRELDNFVYSVSHDLRAPISSVLGLISISKLEKDPQMLEYYDTLKEKSLLKLDSFIKDILDYSRNSRMNIKLSQIDWQNHVLDLLQDYEYLEEAQSIDIEVKIYQKVKFYSDKHRINIILNNLISNAFRYADQTKESPYVKVTGVVDEQKAILRVADNGIGINEKHQSKIFEMFYRAHDHSQGSGLGLYILKEALERINGDIKVASRVGKGTVFSLTIPNQKSEATNEETTSAQNQL